MEGTEKLFLQALKASLNNEKVMWDMEIQPVEWISLFRLAEEHHVLPLIYEAVYCCPAAQRINQQFFAPFKRRMLQTVFLQTMKSSEFVKLFQKLADAGVSPLVVKGIICRSLYPNPDYRISGDEDVLIPAEQFSLCHETMLSFGMQPADSDQDIQAAYEVPYGKPGSPLYIELHKSLFPPESDAYGDFNRFFEKAGERAIEMSVDGIPISTMGYTDHLFYLICHAFKHFLHSGFGIRQVCDIVLFANQYGSEIDWKRVQKQCGEIHAELFTAALFQIGQEYLTFNPDNACYPETWRSIRVDAEPMLKDLLASGAYGDSSMSRKHSSNITLNAVAAQKQGKRAGNGLLKTVFPPIKQMEGRYPYLKKKPYLLPAAWASRILKYKKEISVGANNDAAKSIQIANRRIDLMKQYGIIK